MQIPEFFPGDKRTRSIDARRSREYHESLARRAERAWHDLGHTNVVFCVDEIKRYGMKILHNGNPLYSIRSNLVNGLPPKEVA